MRFRLAVSTTALLSALLCSSLAVAGESGLFGTQNPDAPAGVQQYGQFEGNWICVPGAKQEDGSFKDTEARPRWVWRYALNGHAVQDFWFPDTEVSAGAPMGTNLRVYDPTNDEWIMVWSTETMGKFQTFTAKMIDGDIVMRGEMEAGQFPAQRARITFHNISDDHFDWKYEASAPGDGENWGLQSTLGVEV